MHACGGISYGKIARHEFKGWYRYSEEARNTVRQRIIRWRIRYLGGFDNETAACYHISVRNPGGINGTNETNAITDEAPRRTYNYDFRYRQDNRPIAANSNEACELAEASQEA